MTAAFPTVIERAQSVPDSLRDWRPKSDLGLSILKIRRFVPEDLWLEILEKIKQTTVVESSLRVQVLRGLGLHRAGLIAREDVKVEDHGVVSRRLVTDVGVGFIVDAFQNLVELEIMKFHGIGTGSTAEAAGDTALVTELTTEYNPNATRATGTTAETSANIFQSVATNTLDSGTPALREHGLFSAAAVGVLMDRSVFAAINLTGANGDALTTDYRLTFTSGG